MIFGAIVAGGIGSRMNLSGLPKQFLPLGDAKKPIIIHTLEKFLLSDRLDYIYIGVHKDWIGYAEELIAKYEINSSKIIVVEGGKDRNETIANIIKAIESKHTISDDIIVTHDAVRPFVTIRMIHESIDAAIECGASDVVVPTVDTIIESQDGKIIHSVPNRKYLYNGQTPQTFKISDFMELYSSLTNEEKDIMTDACKIFALRGKPVKLVPGDPMNIKITTTSDYKIALAIIGEEQD